MVSYNINTVLHKTKKTLGVRKRDVFVSGTSVSNYLLKEPLIDWLELYYQKLGFNKNRVLRSRVVSHRTSVRKSQTDNILFKNGLVFETCVYDAIDQKFGAANVVNLKAHLYTDSEFSQTMEAIQTGIPIIFQAYLKSETLQLHGVADMLVRGDYINAIVKTHVIDVTDSTHYYVVDIKWSNMQLCVDGKTIRNTGRFRAYKGQLMIYNTILGEMQGALQRYAFILAKSWNIDKKAEGYSCFDRLGVVDFEEKDNVFVEKTADAINWVRTVRHEGMLWSPLFPHITEMCCNACNPDEKWSSVKKEILGETHDITQLWMITPEKRDQLFKRGIRRWDDKRCTREVLDGTQTTENILLVNKTIHPKLFVFSKLYDSEKWKKDDGVVDFFIDYETISEHFDEQNENMNIYNSKSLKTFIFMIGVGIFVHGNFTYKSFTCEKLSVSDEISIFSQFNEFVEETCKNKTPRFFHWGHVEKTLLEDFCRRQRYEFRNFRNIIWIDLYRVFTQSHIAIKGAVCYKLKEIANCMYEHGYIKTRWVNSHIQDGVTAMKEALLYYKSGSGNMDDITKYNEIDCTVLYEIVEFLRSL